MKKVIFILLGTALLTGCTAEPLENYESQTVDKIKIERPGSQRIYMEEVDKDKIQRPGSQSND